MSTPYNQEMKKKTSDACIFCGKRGKLGCNEWPLCGETLHITGCVYKHAELTEEVQLDFTIWTKEKDNG